MVNVLKIFDIDHYQEANKNKSCENEMKFYNFCLKILNGFLYFVFYFFFSLR